MVEVVEVAIGRLNGMMPCGLPLSVDLFQQGGGCDDEILYVWW